MEEEIDIICQRIAIVNEYHKLIESMNEYHWRYSCYFSDIFDYELNKWLRIKQISHKNYDWLERIYPEYRLYKKIISSWEASHHKRSFSQLSYSLKNAIKIYESGNYVVELDSNYLNYKNFIKNFKFTPPCQ